MGLQQQRMANDGRAISIHPSRVGWDAFDRVIFAGITDFNPPIPCGMGRHHWRQRRQSADFNPPIPCGMGLVAPVDNDLVIRISIHPSRVGWDFPDRKRMALRGHFNPPIPCGMGLSQQGLSSSDHHISIHPSRVGWDPPSPLQCRMCGRFQSTHPVWDGTLNKIRLPAKQYISIHPSRVGWDASGKPPKYPLVISIHPSRVGWDFSVFASSFAM